MTTDAPELPAWLVTLGSDMDCICSELGTLADAMTIIATSYMPEREAGLLERIRVQAADRLIERAQHRRARRDS